MRSKTAVVAGLINFGVVALFVLLGVATPVGSQRGPVPPVIALLLLWLVLSVFYALYGLGFALDAVLRREAPRWTAMGLLLNGGYFAAYGYFFWSAAQQ